MISRKLRGLRLGIATYIIPSLRHRLGTGGTDSARYCYSVWLRHLRKCRDQGIREYPRVVAELGPGDSLGIGLAALLSVADKYYAFDIVEHASNEKNVEIFDELLELFQQRADIPGEDEFPRVHPLLDSYDFPSDILSEEHLNRMLDKRRVERLRASVMSTEAPGSPVKYIVPWIDSSILEKDSVDMIFSQAVLEHVDALEEAYQAMRAWLKPTGIMSHEFDFKCHKSADEWDGHWTYSDVMWKLIRGRRPWFLNRQPHSVHLDMLKRTGFSVIYDDPFRSDSTIDKEGVARSLRKITDDDLTISSAFMISLPDTLDSTVPDR